MFLEKFPITGKVLIASNFIPLIGVFFLGWDPINIVVLYWTESLVVGFYHVIKIMLHRQQQYHFVDKKIIEIPFFITLFGIFCLLHGMLIIELFPIGPIPFWPKGALIQLFETFSWSMWIGVLGMLLSHGYSLYWYYIRHDGSKGMTFDQLRQQPFRRVLVMHIVVTFGGLSILNLEGTTGLLTILVFAKTLLDLEAHLREHGVISWRELIST